MSRSSRGPDVGTRVSLTVPLDPADTEASDGSARAETEPHAMKVLIADDHGIVRSGLRMLLERQLDIEVVGEASDGAEARDMAIRERPDLAILDVKMPKLTGLQATREIRAQAPGRGGPDPVDVRRRALPVRGAQGRAPRATCSRPRPTPT